MSLKQTTRFFAPGWKATRILALVTLSGLLHAQPSAAPDTSVDGPVLEFEFPGLKIGIAEYDTGPTGTTVFHFPEPVKAVIDVRGGSPGTISSGGLAGQYDEAYTNAVVFSGGSEYGLAAATGAAQALRDRADNPGDWRQIAFTPGAIIYDLGWRRLNAVTPDAELGRAALESARPGVFPLGPQGAGRFAMQGWYFEDPQHSGQGGAIRAHGDVRVAVFTVVNPVGTIVDRSGRVVRCGQPPGSTCPTISDRLEMAFETAEPDAPEPPSSGMTTNTTLTLVVVNVDLPVAELKRLAMQVHGSMARAIQPFSTLSDGDTLIAVTTGDVEAPDWDSARLGALASETAWDAVLASVPPLPELHEVTPVEWTTDQLDEIVGDYRFSRWARISIERRGEQLLATGPEPKNLYFPEGQAVRLIPISQEELVIDGPARHRIGIERRDGRVIGLTLNPGPWAQFAEKGNGH